MPFWIKCSNPKCGKETYARNITTFLKEHIYEKDRYSGYIMCTECKQPTGYVEKEFNLQETEANGKKEQWHPIIRGAIKINNPLKKSGSRADAQDIDKAEFSYQPFVYLISYEPKGKIEDYWFSYYKDTRNEKKGRLKMGYGPGGPPVISKKGILNILQKLLALNLITEREIRKLL